MQAENIDNDYMGMEELVNALDSKIDGKFCWRSTMGKKNKATERNNLTLEQLQTDRGSGDHYSIYPKYVPDRQLHQQRLHRQLSPLLHRPRRELRCVLEECCTVCMLMGLRFALTAPRLVNLWAT